MTQIKGTNVIAPVVPFDTTDSHATHEARYGKGGYRSVADIAERDAIPQLRREAGMLVLTMSDGKFWRLASDLAAWSEIGLAGPQGPQGVPGVPGPQGIPGVAGVAGPAGVAGAKGDRGDVGPQGIPGVAGPKGDPGERGQAGPAGEAGAQGIQGIPGVAGATGAKGDRGDVGPQGPAGVAGQQGIQGPAGVAGATGPQGPAASLVYASISDFPATGSAIALYLAEDTSRLYQWESPVYVEVGTSGGGIATTSASDLTSGTLADARLSSNVPRLEHLIAWTGQSSNVVETFPRSHLAFSGLALVSGQVVLVFFTPLVTTTVSQISMNALSTAASGLTLARMGLFTFNETTATLVARTASDTTLFTQTRTVYTRSFDSSGGFPATYTLTAGTRYGVGVIAVGTTMPLLSGTTPPFEIATLAPRLSAARTGQSDLGTLGSFGTTSAIPYARLS